MYSLMSGCAISDFILACGCGFLWLWFKKKV